MTASGLSARRPLRSLRASRHGLTRRGPVSWLLLALAALVALLMVSPFLLLLNNSLKSEGDYLRGGPLALPSEISFDAWARYIGDANYPGVLLNSIVISSAVAVLAVIVATLASYAIGIGRIRGNSVVLGVLLFATMLPQEALLYPLYYGAQTLGLRNTLVSVIVIFTVLQAAYGTYLLSSVLGTFPREVLEAAALDGASRWQQLWRIVFPMMRPTISVLLVFFFIWTWNEFLIPLVLLLDPSVQTVPIALASLKGQLTTDVVELNAGAMLSFLPTLIFFLIFQRTLTRGVAAGSAK